MRILTTLLLSAMALTVSSTAFAVQAEFNSSFNFELPRPSVMQSNGLDLGDAVEQVRRQCDGRIISAVTKRNGNRETHEIKCLTNDGTVRTFRIPGKRSG